VSSPSVYIVILNWNGLDDTLECLASIAKLSYSNVKTIVVDNGSEDDQAAVIAKAFPNVYGARATENLGFCGGCNVGIKEALEKNADFVMLLNNDTLVSPALIEKHT
jgi:GT2 family glycosyltransferase